MIHANALVFHVDEVSASVPEGTTPQLHQFINYDIPGTTRQAIKQADFVIFIEPDGKTHVIKNRWGNTSHTPDAPEPEKVNPYILALQFFGALVFGCLIGMGMSILSHVK